VGNIGPVERLGFHGLCLQDGPLGIREALYASVFPAGLTAAASWDRGLIYQRGLYMGEEFRGKGAHVALGPVAGPLGRNALGGRNWEGFSPDPYLTGVAMERTITAMQSTGLQACAKHFIANEQETQRNPSPGSNGTTIESVSSNLDDRTMHELYLWPFADAVRAGVASVMCSYNRINGSYGCQNSKNINGLLKGELGFQGYVMSGNFKRLLNRLLDVLTFSQIGWQPIVEMHLFKPASTWICQAEIVFSVPLCRSSAPT